MIEAFGWVAAAIGIVSNIPQLLRIMRTRTSAGVSLRLWQLTTATAAAWACHGFLVGTPQMQWPNLVMLLAALLIVVFVLRDRGQRIAPQLILPVGLAALLSGLDVWLGAVVFGFAVAVPQLVGQFAQTRSLVRSPDLTGVSGTFLAVFLLVQSLWWGFGFATEDWALIVCAGLMVIICIANLAIYLVRSLRARRQVALAV